MYASWHDKLADARDAQGPVAQNQSYINACCCSQRADHRVKDVAQALHTMIMHSIVMMQSPTTLSCTESLPQQGNSKHIDHLSICCMSL
jgi:hypothetical protein